jgi:hypothetical protein
MDVRSLFFHIFDSLALMSAMKKTIIFTLLFVSFLSHAGITIISDLDDTIKITEASGNPGDLLGEDVYAGMPIFYKAASEYADTLHILSASPSFLRSKIQNTLRKHDIRYESLVLRTNVFENKFRYKVREIARILDASSDDFLLIGDDLGDDPEVFDHIIRNYPGRILGAYIHIVRGRTIPETVKWYLTSFDLILMEHEFSRAGATWVRRIFDELMSTNNPEFIFPREAYCPSEAAIWEWQMRTVFTTEARRLTAQFIAICQARQSDNIYP